MLCGLPLNLLESEDMLVSVQDLLGPWKSHKDVTPAVLTNLAALALCIDKLLMKAREAGIRLKVNKSTGTLIAGKRYGGFRPQDCPEGAPGSAHKVGKAGDIYDPDNVLDAWCTDEILTECNLYREHPDKTDGWTHLTIRAPGSKKRTFWP